MAAIPKTASTGTAIIQWSLSSHNRKSPIRIMVPGGANAKNPIAAAVPHLAMLPFFRFLSDIPQQRP